jgi:hypothetical protein
MTRESVIEHEGNSNHIELGVGNACSFNPKMARLKKLRYVGQR